MEIKVGIADSPRELMVSLSQSQDEVQQLVDEALRADKGLLVLADDRGHRFVVPASRIAYVEIGTSGDRRVGFAVGK